MHTIIIWFFDVLIAGSFFGWLLQTTRSRRRTLPLPPGPPRLPFIGNVLSMPKSHLWEKAAAWKKDYGDIIYLENFGSPLVVLNSYEATVDLLEKKSIKYSSRPVTTMLNELQDWSWLEIFVPYGSLFKAYRGPIQKAFNTADVVVYKDIQRQSARILLSTLLQAPSNFKLNIKTSVVRTIMLATYGHEVVETNDPYVALAEEGTLFAGSACVPGRFLVDMFPWLKYMPAWLPGANFQKLAQRGRQLSHDMRYVPYEDSRDKMLLNGEASRSFTAELIEQRLAEEGKLTPADDDLISAVAGMVYAAGTDSIATVLQTFMLAMTLFPEAQKRGQEEIDRIVGRDRLPDFEDRQSLPYVEAIYKECLRWNLPQPLGVPHLLTEDDTHNGYFLPAGTLVAANQWWMMHDPVEFPHPELFKPERFLPGPGGNSPLDPNKVVFGFGRRICAGKMMAETTLYIAMVSILAAFDIAVPSDAAGNPVPPLADFDTESLVVHPKPFSCMITPRSEKIPPLIAQSVELNL